MKINDVVVFLENCGDNDIEVGNIGVITEVVNKIMLLGTHRREMETEIVGHYIDVGIGYTDLYFRDYEIERIGKL